jgi:hypothetical protein
MPERTPPLVVPLIALAVVLMFVLALRTRGAASAPQQDRQVGHVTAQERASTFAFDPTATPVERDAFLAAVGDARPEAQQLIGAVDGLVDVHVASTAEGIAGTTETLGARYAVTVNLGAVSRRYGRRGIDRTVLHELGHVVDFALVDPALRAQLDAATPQGYGCDGKMMGGCADTRERFAESFAKWATGDIGVDLYLGYKVPPPDDLASWGAPLATVAGA